MSRTTGRWLRLLVMTIALMLLFPATASATHHRQPTATLLTSGLATATGSGTAVGPDGAVYVTEGEAGRIVRVDPETGAVSTWADGLPPALAPVGGVMDVEFVQKTAYALVTMVGPDLGGSDVVGIYRIDGPHLATPIADIGTWQIDNPSESEVFIPSGVQYAMQWHHGSFYVTDGHHNRVLKVKLNGDIREYDALPNIVPTGLDFRGNNLYVALAGPNPHLAEDGRVLQYRGNRHHPSEVASGARLLVDVEFGPRGRLYGLSQGYFDPANPDGAPAEPTTGALMVADRRGDFVNVFDGIDRPTSFEIIGRSAYITTLGGEVWRIDNI